MPPHAMHPNLSGPNPGAAETLDADREVGAPRLFDRLCEIPIAIDQSRIEMQAGIEKHRMQPGLAIDGEIRGSGEIPRNDAPYSNPKARKVS